MQNSHQFSTGRCLVKATIAIILLIALFSTGIYYGQQLLTIDEVASRFCSPKLTLCVVATSPRQSYHARSKCRRTVSLRVLYKRRRIYDLVLTFGERVGHKSGTQCQDSVEDEESFRITPNVSSSWRQIGGPNSFYADEFSKVELKFGVTETMSLSLELRLFDALLGVRVNTAGTVLGKTFFKTTIVFPKDAEGKAYLDKGDENGYMVAKLTEYCSYNWGAAVQALPIAFILTRPRTATAISEACNEEITNLRLRPRRLKEGSFRPRDGFRGLFQGFRRTSPFVVFHFADTAETLATQHGLAGLLCDIKTTSPVHVDASWVVPGTVIRNMGLSTNSAIEYMKVCSALNVRYLLSDAGWYGPEESSHSDPLSPSPASGSVIDIARVSRFGESLDPPVYTMFYLNDRVLQNHTRVELIASKLSSLGVRGVKMGFVKVNNASGIQRLVTNIKIFEAHRIVLNIHDSFRDYYLSRKFPSVLSVEGVRGSEHGTDETTNQLILPLTRLLSGRMDYTYTTSQDSLTRHGNISMLYQICLPFLFQNGLQHLFWYQSARRILTQTKSNPYFYLWKLLPPSYRRSVVLEYDVAESICMARQLPDDPVWFIFGVSLVPHTFVLRLAFLATDTVYKATVYRENVITNTEIRIGNSFKHVESLDARTGFFIILRSARRITKKQPAPLSRFPVGSKEAATSTRAEPGKRGLVDPLLSYTFVTPLNGLWCAVLFFVAYLVVRQINRRERRVSAPWWSKGKVV